MQIHSSRTLAQSEYYWEDPDAGMENNRGVISLKFNQDQGLFTTLCLPRTSLPAHVGPLQFLYEFV